QLFFARVLCYEKFYIQSGSFAGTQKSQHRSVCNADAMLAVRLPIQVDSERGQNLLPAAEVNRFAVYQDAIEIKEYRFILPHLRVESDGLQHLLVDWLHLTKFVLRRNEDHVKEPFRSFHCNQHINLPPTH